MKIKVFFALLLNALFISSGVAQVAIFNISGTVKDTSGRGIKGVVVNDGVNFTQTDAQGRWALRTDTMVSKFISISTPAAYRLPAKDGIASGFYRRVNLAVKGKNGVRHAPLAFGGDGRHTPHRRFP